MSPARFRCATQLCGLYMRFRKFISNIIRNVLHIQLRVEILFIFLLSCIEVLPEVLIYVRIGRVGSTRHPKNHTAGIGVRLLAKHAKSRRAGRASRKHSHLITGTACSCFYIALYPCFDEYLFRWHPLIFRSCSSLLGIRPNTKRAHFPIPLRRSRSIAGVHCRRYIKEKQGRRGYTAPCLELGGHI